MGLNKHDNVSKMKKVALGVAGLGLVVAGVWGSAGALSSQALAQVPAVESVANVGLAVASATKNVSLANGTGTGDTVSYTLLDQEWTESVAHIRGIEEVEGTKEYTPAYAAHLERLAVKQKEEKELEAKRAELLKDPDYQDHLRRLALKTDPEYQAHLARLAVKQKEDKEYQEHLVRLYAKQTSQLDPSLSSRHDYDPATGEIITIYDRAVDQIPRDHKQTSARTQNLLAKLDAGAGAGNNVASLPGAISVKATAYVSDCIGCSGITATGLDVRKTTPQIIAVDPSVIPLGTKLDLWVEGVYFGVYTASDTGGLIKGAKIDVLLETAEDAVRFGKASAVVRVHDGSLNLVQPAQDAGNKVAPVTKPKVTSPVPVSSKSKPSAQVKEQKKEVQKVQLKKEAQTAKNATVKPAPESKNTQKETVSKVSKDSVAKVKAKDKESQEAVKSTPSTNQAKEEAVEDVHVSTMDAAPAVSATVVEESPAVNAVVVEPPDGVQEP